MKVIELLMQGEKVWDKDKKGYFELDLNSKRLYHVCIGKNGRISYPEINLNLGLKEGEIYTGIEWKNVPFGTKVIGWNEGDTTKNVGKFLAYDDDDTELPFFIFLEQDMRATWVARCELLNEEEC